MACCMVFVMAKVTVNIPEELIEAAKRHIASGETVSGLAARGLRLEIVRRDALALASAGWPPKTESDDWAATIEADRAASGR